MYVTIYTRKPTKREARVQPTRMGAVYRTQRLTPFHEHIRKTYPDAQTWEDPKLVITDLVAGLNLGTLPIVVGGKRCG